MRIGNYLRQLRISDPVKSYDVEKKFKEISDAIQRLPIYIGAGTPEGEEAAPVGSLFLRIDGGAGTTLYVKESGEGDTGWIGK
jgi:hypothetical protein